MKKEYVRPQVEWFSIQPDEPIAARCWADAGKQLYHDLPGYGYCLVTLSSGGCGKAKVVGVVIPDELGFTSQEKLEAEQWMMDHLTEKMAAAGNNMANFDGNGFFYAPDPSWS